MFGDNNIKMRVKYCPYRSVHVCVIKGEGARARDRICVVRSHSIKDESDLKQPFGRAPPPQHTSASPADLPKGGSGGERKR